MDKRENSSKVYRNAGERKYCQCSLVMETVTNQIQKRLLRIIISAYSTQPDGKENVLVLKSACAHTAPCKQTDSSPKAV